MISKTITFLSLLVLVSSRFTFHRPHITLGDGEDEARAFIDCVKVALDGGIPGLMPDHNPLWIRDRDIPLNLTEDISAVIGTRDLILNGTAIFDLVDVMGTYTEEPERIYYTYLINYPQMRLWGGIEANVTIGEEVTEHNITIDISLNDLNFTGFWNMSLPNENQKMHLDGFHLKINTDNVQVSIQTRLGELFDGVVSSTLQAILESAMKEVDGLLDEGLLNRFNDFWIDPGTEKIDLILSNCHKKLVNKM